MATQNQQGGTGFSVYGNFLEKGKKDQIIKKSDKWKNDQMVSLDKTKVF
jgi:hypothetical protein